MDKATFKALTKEELAALYADFSTAQIAARFGVGAEIVRLRMVRLGIPRRSRGGRRTFHPNEAELRALYQEKSMNQIAKMYDVGETVVWKRLKEFGIKLRDFEDGGHRKKPGRHFTKEHRDALSRAHEGRAVGEDHPRWKGGATAKLLRLRATGAYKRWKRDALELRGNACQECGVKNRSECECCGTRVRLHVHHVESFARNEARRFDPTNSEVLCPKCHHSRHFGKIA